jgi:hypothetical protein
MGGGRLNLHLKNMSTDAPNLVFATPAWSPWLAADIQIVEKVQEKAVGMIFL